MEAKFKFTLEKLLDIRIEKEKESKRKFTKTQKEKQIAEEKLEELTNSYNKYNGINPGETLNYQKIKKNYLFALDKGINQVEKELESKTRELEVRRTDLVKKQVDRKTVDILKENKKIEFYKEQDRVEQITLDELALYAYIRNS